MSYRGGGKGVCKRKENEKLSLLLFGQGQSLMTLVYKLKWKIVT
jgi:hypothetical protein